MGSRGVKEIEDLVSSFDEMVTGEGSVRPHWRTLSQTVWGISPQRLAEKQMRAATQIAAADELIALHEPGVVAATRALDLLPLILPEPEWQNLRCGLVQRARLLNAILADLYGPQDLLEEGLIPPRLVFENPAFLRPLCQVEPVGGAPQLYVYAADLIRLPNGEWRVFSDRTQAEAGVGYALHNRNMLARVFPEAFRAIEVRRLEPFIELWQQSIRGVGAALSPQPRIALLTPGPYNDAYFEHVLLARELGITLVQSADLTIRGDRVFLKTVQGLVAIDVIYRRVDGDYCDSLELREESELGVPGLIGVARRGQVAILNMPGTALVGTPALAAFLPQLCRRLLGEKLRLPAVTTWWCGQQHALDQVLAAFDKFAFQSVFELDPVLTEPDLLSAQERAAFQQQLLADPGNFVAREKMAPSQAPCLSIDLERTKTILSPQPIVLRVPCLWDGGDWSPLPGGVARVATGQSIYAGALRPGGITKDVWVLAGDDQQVGTIAKTAPPSASSEWEEAVLRSRTADDLYWLGRYVERLDAGMRQFKAAFRRLVSGGMSPRDHAELARLAQALAQTGWIPRTMVSAAPDGSMFGNGLADAATDGTTLRSCVDSIRRLTVAVRDQLSFDLWHTLHRITGRSFARFGTSRRGPDVLIEAVDRTVNDIAAFAGLASENMIRGAGWRFLDLGRRLQRGIDVAGMTRGVMAGPASQFEAGLHLALELGDASSAYLLRYRIEPHLSRALELVVADRTNPRSLIFQLRRIEQILQTQATIGAELAGLLALQQPIAAIEAFAFEISRPELAEETILSLQVLLDMTTASLTALSDGITRGFFSHVASTRLSGIMHRRSQDRIA